MENKVATIEDVVAHIRKNADDNHPENVLDRMYGGLIKDFVEIEDADWDDEGKYSHGTFTYKVILQDDSEHYLEMSVSRSGSYFSDYYYFIDHVDDVEKYEGSTTITIVVSGEDTARAVAQLEGTIENEVGNHLDGLSAKISVDKSVKAGWK